MIRYSELTKQGGVWSLLGPEYLRLAHYPAEAQGAVGLLGPGVVPPTYIAIEDESAHGLACQELGHQPKTPKRPSTRQDLKKACELGDKLGRIYRHPLALAASRGLKVFGASLEWLGAAYPSPSGHQTVGIASRSTKEVFYSSERPRRTQLSIIAHEIGHFLSRTADEDWCQTFAEAFLQGCAAKCYMGNLNLLELKRASGGARPKLKVA